MIDRAIELFYVCATGMRIAQVKLDVSAACRMLLTNGWPNQPAQRTTPFLAGSFVRSVADSVSCDCMQDV